MKKPGKLAAPAFRQLERTRALHPLGAIRHQLAETDLRLVDAGEDAEVLPQVVALLQRVQVAAHPDQRERLAGLGDGSQHLHRSEGESLERLPSPGREARRLL